METTLAYLVGNDPHLAEDLISILASMVVSFFSVEKEVLNESKSEQVTETEAEPSEPGCTDLCPSIDNGAGPVQSGEHTETVRPEGNSNRTWLAGRNTGIQIFLSD